MHTYNKVVLALGSNLGNKKEHLQNAINHIHNHIGFVAQASAIYETPSWGFESFPFYNMCILIHTNLSPEKLLVELKKTEKILGRTTKNTENYEARTVDIDIVYFNDLIFNSTDLQIPHKELQNRKFVLVPLNDLIFDWKHPILQKSTQELLVICDDESEIKQIDYIDLPKDDFAIGNIKFLAIEGNIGSGKTSLAEKIAQDFNAKPILERFADNAFLPKFYEDQLRYAFPLEMSFLADRYSQLNQGLGQYNLFNDFIVADYYIYKSLIFAQVTLDTDEAFLYRSIFDVMNKETTKPDLYVYLHQNTENLLQNIKKRGRTYEENIQAAYLDNINQSYSEFIKTLTQENVLIIDVSKKDFVENHEDYLEVLKLINNKIKQIEN
ncbi:2-amino-4-hydroxy-6-hydroxymethyldihydropteridine diphosphokinase [Paenimyroides baculatum]|uniref:2-amino-4-hydroxy-6-hydroxymethyldihydropteridine pyrophosphokinase n=1 Tax=Paenimyroides baculatum TaxID=2608000 RepID=A0A5M6CLZ5_9FLAO|nr:2-amino-4-hydroxy-6-hydroxymethyldihydropteridine diphosphokinase [Paenimyroides baculatum]KAA5535997.1 2-amino-4-hydroxy-6-hydroxymethyldihydropteridine diphosphokinase [Paenimyroides baculatum]